MKTAMLTPVVVLTLGSVLHAQPQYFATPENKVASGTQIWVMQNGVVKKKLDGHDFRDGAYVSIDGMDIAGCFTCPREPAPQPETFVDPPTFEAPKIDVNISEPDPDTGDVEAGLSLQTNATIAGGVAALLAALVGAYKKHREEAEKDEDEVEEVPAVV